MTIGRNRNPRCRVPGSTTPTEGMAHVREADPPPGMALAINLFRWSTGERQVICHLTGELTREKVAEIGVGLARDEERLEGTVLWVVQHGDPALHPPPGRVRELVWVLNSYSLPFRRGRWLRVCRLDDGPQGHTVVFTSLRQAASPGDELHCLCGLSVTLTGTDVICASGHPIDAAV